MVRYKLKKSDTVFLNFCQENFPISDTSRLSVNGKYLASKGSRIALDCNTCWFINVEP